MYRITIEEAEKTEQGNIYKKVYRQVFRELDVCRVVTALNQREVIIRIDGADLA